MRILTVHSKYQVRGGEDECLEGEHAILAEQGHETRYLIFDNSRISGWNVCSTALHATWSQSAYRRVLSEIRAWRPDVLAVHNFFPLASPSVCYAGSRARIPVVQTLHNYRIICPGSTLLRDGRICEDCTKSALPWPGVLHGCYRSSRLGTLAVATMITVHRTLATWQRRVTVFVARTEFARRKFVAAGLPAHRIIVKPDFVPFDLGPGSGDGDYLLYAGRLSVEKGVATLLEAWKRADTTGRLIIVGEGPLAERVQHEARMSNSVVYLGKRLLLEVYELMGRARAVVLPSVWYEMFGRTIIEAFCRGTPVVTSNIGSMLEMVTHGKTGWLVPPSDPIALSAALHSAMDPNQETGSMRTAARQAYEAKYTREQNYKQLIAIYERAILLNQDPLAITQAKATCAD